MSIILFSVTHERHNVSFYRGVIFAAFPLTLATRRSTFSHAHTASNRLKVGRRCRAGSGCVLSWSSISINDGGCASPDISMLHSRPWPRLLQYTAQARGLRRIFCSRWPLIRRAGGCRASLFLTWRSKWDIVAVAEKSLLRSWKMLDSSNGDEQAMSGCPPINPLDARSRFV